MGIFVKEKNRWAKKQYLAGALFSMEQEQI